MKSELPRDSKGRVIGTWHVAEGKDPRAMGASIEGDMVDRAVALGCKVAPGPRPKPKAKPKAEPKTEPKATEPKPPRTEPPPG